MKCQFKSSRYPHGEHGARDLSAWGSALPVDSPLWDSMAIDGRATTNLVRNGSDPAVAECTAYPPAAHSRDRLARQLFEHYRNALGP